MYKASIKPQIVTQNTIIQADKNLNSLIFQNKGEGSVTLLDNILLEPGDSFSYENEPDVIIDQDINIRFSDLQAVNKVLIIKRYIK